MQYVLESLTSSFRQSFRRLWVGSILDPGDGKSRQVEPVEHSLGAGTVDTARGAAAKIAAAKRDGVK